MDRQVMVKILEKRQKTWGELFEKFEKMQAEDDDTMHSDEDSMSNDSFSEDNESDSEDNDNNVNANVECYQTSDDELVDPNLFLQQFRTMCRQKIETWNEYREHNTIEYSGNKQCIKSFIERSSGRKEENYTTGLSVTPLKMSMKALALATPNKIKNKISNQTKNSTQWENISDEECGQQNYKVFSNSIKRKPLNKTSDIINIDNKIDTMEKYDDRFEEITVTTTTTTTTTKSIRRVSKNYCKPLVSNVQDSLSDCADSESDTPSMKLTSKRSVVSDSKVEPITPKKRSNLKYRESKQQLSAIIVAEPSKTPKTISKKIMTETILAEHPDIDTSRIRDYEVNTNETLLVAPMTPSMRRKSSKLLAIEDNTPKKGKDVFSQLVLGSSKKAIVIRQKTLMPMDN